MSSIIETPIAAAFKSSTQPNRKSSQTTTLCCSPTSLNQKLVTSTESFSRRSSSTPLADRFMSANIANNSNPITINTTNTANTNNKPEQKNSRESIIYFTTPDYSQNDQQPFTTPCATTPSPPPPLYFLSYDPVSPSTPTPGTRYKQQQQQYCRSSSKHNRQYRSSPTTTSSPCCCCTSASFDKQNYKYNHRSRRSHHRYRDQQSRKDRIVDVHQKPYIQKEKTPSKKRHEVAIKIDEDKDRKEGGVTVPEKRERRRKSTEKRIDSSSRIGCCCFIRKWKEEDNKSLGKASSNKRRVQCFCYCGRREWVMFAFISVLVAFILAFLFWPRTPLIRIEGAMRTGSTKVVTQTQQGSERMMMGNVAFESIWLLNITMDNRRNYLPTTRFNRIQIFAKDAMTGLLIGKGIQNEYGQVDIPGHTISTVQLPISINYQARDKSDTTFLNLLKACTNMTLEQEKQQHQQHHHTLPIQFWFTLYIFGLDWLGYKPSLIATPATGGFICPL